MKARINAMGELMIKRPIPNGEDYQDLLCPLGGHLAPCSDKCPLFGEPDKIVVKDLGGEISQRIGLSLCHKNYIFMPEDFEDLRGVMLP